MKKFFALIIFSVTFFAAQISFAADINFIYQAHVQNYGWRPPLGNGEIVGAIGEGLRMEALRISMLDGSKNMVQYCAHIQNYGWLDWQYSGGIAGSVGRELRMEAVKIRLLPKYAALFDVYYRAYVENYGWLGWARNGEPAGTAGASLRMEAIQIFLVPRGTHFDRDQPPFYEQRRREPHYI